MNHGSCIHHLELDICFDEYNYHDSHRARLMEGIDHWDLVDNCRYSYMTAGSQFRIRDSLNS